ncbi:MAG TPA: MerR family transcriptional regulator [Acidimicrobiales bacterium]|nr:MerR family transcriptional regulator [Acidimicrobiales bacterium]
MSRPRRQAATRMAVRSGTVAGEPGDVEMLGISRAAAECGVSERALRYYQQIGLLTPTGITPGGMRRYAPADLARVRRIRDLQSLLGFDLDEIRIILDSDDRLAAIKEQYRVASEGSARRRELLRQALSVREDLVRTVDAKLAALHEFRAELETSRARVQQLLAETRRPVKVS